MEQLARLRLQLTAWYAGVLGLVLLVLGVGLFLTVRRQMARHLDVSLRAAAAALEQAARIRETERAAAHGAVGRGSLGLANACRLLERGRGGAQRDVQVSGHLAPDREEQPHAQHQEHESQHTGVPGRELEPKPRELLHQRALTTRSGSRRRAAS